MVTMCESMSGIGCSSPDYRMCKALGHQVVFIQCWQRLLTSGRRVSLPSTTLLKMVFTSAVSMVVVRATQTSATLATAHS